MMRKLFLLALATFAVIQMQAQDRMFARTYQSNILPKGNFDIEVWHTSRFGHEGQYFHAMEQRLEFETGLGKNVQTAVYLNRFQKSVSDSAGAISQATEIGISNEWKWKVSRATSPVGIALYGEWGLKGDEIELETKFIADRSFGKNVVAFNAVYELEFEAEREHGETEFELEETPLEFDLAFMHNFTPAFGLGVEIRDHNELVKGAWEHSVLFAGPTVNFRGQRWFAIVNYLPQLANIHKSAAAPKNKVLDEHERAEARLLVGFSF